MEPSAILALAQPALVLVLMLLFMALVFGISKYCFVVGFCGDGLAHCCDNVP